MSDLIDIGSAWLRNQRRAYMARTVTYMRGVQSVEIELVTVGVTTFEADLAAGILVEFETRDYLIDASDLVIGGSGIEPEAGDIIQESLQGIDQQFIVVAPAGGTPWRWHDRSNRTYRIHTKAI